MLDFSQEFLVFDGEIKLTSARKDRVIKSRNAVRDKIKKYYRDTLVVNQPRFRVQGSFSIDTALNPLEGGDVDTDDGVYLNHIDSSDVSTWLRPSECHSQILEALEGHTQDGCESKTSCVRVLYRNFYHLDLPVYIMRDGKAFLAQTKSDEWINSDSKDFRDWYYQNRNDQQTSRFVRYLKAWRDFLGLDIPSIELTILAAICHGDVTENEDAEFLKTVRKILEKIETDRAVKKPVSPYEDLWAEKSSKQKEQQIEKYRDLLHDLESALYNTSYNRASTIFRSIFGERFPEKADQAPKQYSQTTAGPKPWGQ